ncbi:hypothetical protein AVEN_147911-1 [Araneus ventricosus]|uniref:Gustatory receptor n=1 Tax=Araneus ventricosus TaxID=182803 RepID=A0A4Y2P5T3_ARAVE|nr:hypothetical protein AVEN_147911-1 [Araneus ventricosus]
MEIKMQSEVNKEMAKSLPKPIKYLMETFGLELAPSITRMSNRCNAMKNSCIKTKIIGSHLFLLFSIVFGIFADKHLTFYISGNLDLVIYLIAIDILYCRRKKIQCHVKNLLQIPTELLVQQQRHKFTNVCVMMAIAGVFAVIYSTLSVMVIIKKKIQATESTDDTINAAKFVLNIFQWLFYAIHTYIGIPMQACLFAFLCLLVNERLNAINMDLQDMVQKKVIPVSQIRQLRAIFCDLQKTSSEVDAVFREINFIWLIKIIIRCCMSFYDILTMAWYEGFVSDQIIVLLDVMFDIAHLAVLCITAGKIVDSKVNVLESVTCMGKDCVSVMGDLGCEIQFFVSVVGHSKMAMTAANIFPLNKNLAVTLLGVIGSYSVVIYQISN